VEFERSLGDVTATTVETELLTEDVTVDSVTERVTGAEFFFDEAQLSDALDDGRSALVEATATGGEESHRERHHPRWDVTGCGLIGPCMSMFILPDVIPVPRG